MRCDFCTKVIEVQKITDTLEAGKLAVVKTTYALVVRLILDLLTMLPKFLMEYTILPKEKLLPLKHKGSALVAAFLDMVSLLELLTGCREGKANWKSIYEVYHLLTNRQTYS